MARRFTKVDAASTVVAKDGEINGPKDTNLLIGSKWAYLLDQSLITETEPDDTIAEENEAAAQNGLGVETFTPAAKAATTGAAVGTGDGVLVTFTHTAASLPVERGSVVLKVAAASRATDDGKGVISGGSGGTLVTGTINYKTGVMSVTFATAPVNAAAVTVDYEGVSKLTLAGTPVTTASSKMKVYKNSVAMTHGAGAGKWQATGPKEITLGTGANGTDVYLVAYLTVT